jgi:hypothetical protein
MDVILIAGDDESVLCGFAQMAGDLEHAELLELPMPSDILQRVAAGEVSRIVFCPAAVAASSKDATVRSHRKIGSVRAGDPTVIVRGE